MRTAAVIWVDTDIALGGPRGDVDDGFALAAVFAAAKRGTVKVAGVSSVFGNTTASESARLAEELAELAGAATRVFRGSERPGESSEAARRIAQLPEGCELLALGPLTNVAAACRADPGLCSRVVLRAVGGNLSSRGFLPPLWPFEFNLWRDRDAARDVLGRGWRRLHLYPLDVVRRLWADAARLDELSAGSALAASLAAGSRRWLARRRSRRSRRFPLWDLPAALDAVGILVAAARAERHLAPGAARLLRRSRAIPCVTSFDPEESWRRFVSILSEDGFAPGSLPGENGAF